MKRLWKFAHNAIVHPLMEVLPERLGGWLHDRTAARAFSDPPPVTFTASMYCRYQGRILLIKHKLHDWVPPGGRLEVGETPIEAAIRELEEELGWEHGLDYEFGRGVDVLSPPGLLSYEEHDAGPKGVHLNFAFLIEAKVDGIDPCDEFTEHGWFSSLEEVPGSIPPKVRVIARRLFQNPEDEDVLAMNWDQLTDEVRRLRAGIRQHRDHPNPDSCDRYTLATLLPEKKR